MSLSFDMSTGLAPVYAFDVQDQTSATTTNGNILDVGNNRALNFIMTCPGPTPPDTVRFDVYESDDSGMAGETLVDPNDGLTNETDAARTATDANQIRFVGCLSKKRYLRVKVVTTGSGSTAIGIVAAFRRPTQQPTPAIPA